MSSLFTMSKLRTFQECFYCDVTLIQLTIGSIYFLLTINSCEILKVTNAVTVSLKLLRNKYFCNLGKLNVTVGVVLLDVLSEFCLHAYF